MTKSKRVYVDCSCTTCGQQVQKLATELKRHPIPFCSKTCASKGTAARRRQRRQAIKAAYKALNIIRVGPCKDCGRTIHLGPQRQRKYCPDCVRQHKRDHDRIYRQKHAITRRAQQKHILTSGYCRECAKSYVDVHPTKYCSDACRKRNRRRRDKQARSKRITAAAVREVVDLPTVALRDGWQCHICKRKVSKKNWSLDHLVPLSHGGDHTYANVALAHNLCNSLRGANGHAQLRLAA